DAELLGFAHVILDADPQFGALVDNLHVRHDAQRLGIGRHLMTRVAESVIAARPASGIYLSVLRQNTRAQAFYRSLGGEEGDRETRTPAGGGTIDAIRFAWPQPERLLG